MPSPTLRQLAVLAGVSRTTVSMALRDSPRISAATRRKVAKIAKKHGYKPDTLVSALMNKLRISREHRAFEKLAYLTFWPKSAEEWRININETRYFEGACERANARGYELEHFWAKDPEINSDRLGKILRARGIQGIIMAPLPRAMGHVSLDWQYFACASIGLTLVQSRIHRACHGYYDGMTTALRKLKYHGYKRIGFANSSIYDTRVKHGWLSSFLTYQFEIPEKQRVPPLLLNGWREHRFANWVEKNGLPATRLKQWYCEAFAQWVKHLRPDAIVSNTDHPYIFARDLGYRVPEDIAFVQLHRIMDSDPWPGIDRLPKLIGAAATDLVIGQLQNNEIGLPSNLKTIVIDGIWKDGPGLQNASREGSAERHHA